MTAISSIDPVVVRALDPAEFLHDPVAPAPTDLMREPMTSFVNARLGADADAVCGAAYNARTPERVNSLNGYRRRDLDTRLGTVDVAIPKLRSGTNLPEWLLERRRRAEAALTSRSRSPPCPRRRAGR